MPTLNFDQNSVPFVRVYFGNERDDAARFGDRIIRSYGLKTDGLSFLAEQGYTKGVFPRKLFWEMYDKNWIVNTSAVRGRREKMIGDCAYHKSTDWAQRWENLKIPNERFIIEFETAIADICAYPNSLPFLWSWITKAVDRVNAAMDRMDEPTRAAAMAQVKRISKRKRETLPESDEGHWVQYRGAEGDWNIARS